MLNGGLGQSKLASNLGISFRLGSPGQRPLEPLEEWASAGGGVVVGQPVEGAADSVSAHARSKRRFGVRPSAGSTR